MKSLLKTMLMLVLACAPAFGQIQPGKSIMISISGVPAEEKGRIDGAYRVADNGTINMPFIGPVRAAGLKPEVLAAALAGPLSQCADLSQSDVSSGRGSAKARILKRQWSILVDRSAGPVRSNSNAG